MSQTETVVRFDLIRGYLALAILALTPFVTIAWTAALAYLGFEFLRQIF